MNDDHARFEARLHTLLAVSDSDREFSDLRAAAIRELGDLDQVTLAIEYAVERRLNRGRHAETSVTAWADLRRRAEAALAEQHQTLVDVRAEHIRSLRTRCRPGDLTAAVRMGWEELRRQDHSAGGERRGVAAEELALSLLHRARLGRYDATRPYHPTADLAPAADLIDAELARRERRYGPAHPFTCRARQVRAELLVATAETAEPPRRRRCAARAFALTEAGLLIRWQQGQGHTAEIARGLLRGAETLLLMGREREAERRARIVCLLPVPPDEPDDGGRWLALARAVMPRAPRRARSIANRALARRLEMFPETSLRVAEARQVLAAMAGDSVLAGVPADRRRARPRQTASVVDPAVVPMPPGGVKYGS